MEVFNRINVVIILKKHLETFYDYGELSCNGKKKIPFSDIFTFVIFPLLFSVLVVFIGVRLTNDYVNIIITTLSIFVGLLLNLLLLVFDLAKKQKVKNSEYLSRREIIPQVENTKYLIAKELYANISFAIFTSIVTIIAAVLPTLKPKFLIHYLSDFKSYLIIKNTYILTANIVVIFLTILFLLTLLMILKRFFLIFNKEINEI